MSTSEILNILLGTGLVGLMVAVATMKATVRKANADAEKAKADAETVRITNTENATRILVENIVKPLKDELNATRTDLQATKKEMASTKREMARLRKAVEAASGCRHADYCPVLFKLRDNQKTQTQQEQTSSTYAKSDTTAAVTRVITTQTVPESQVHMAISVDSLLKLPEGAAYRENKDRAHVEATHHDGIIYITGTCDSLQRQVEYYEALYHNARDALENYRESVIEERASRKSPFSIYMSGVTCGIILTVAIIGFIKQSK